MSRNKLGPYKIFDNAKIMQATFTVVAATDVITAAAAHGFTEGDVLQFTTATTLPAGLSLATDYYVISTPSTTTFKVSATRGGTTVDITDTGTGTHTLTIKGRVMLAEDAKVIALDVNTSGTANFTVKFVGSNQEDMPDVLAAQSVTNSFDYLDVIDKEDGSSVDGDTGFAPSAADDNRHFIINNDGSNKYITAVITSWTAGKILLTATGFTE